MRMKLRSLKELKGNRNYLLIIHIYILPRSTKKRVSDHKGSNKKSESKKRRKISPKQPKEKSPEPEESDQTQSENGSEQSEESNESEEVE